MRPNPRGDAGSLENGPFRDQKQVRDGSKPPTCPTPHNFKIEVSSPGECKCSPTVQILRLQVGEKYTDTSKYDVHCSVFKANMHARNNIDKFVSAHGTSLPFASDWACVGCFGTGQMDLLCLGMCMQQWWSLNGVFGGALTARILPCAHQSFCAVFRLRYGHVMIMADQDYDGSHIKGLLVNFIHHFWPELLIHCPGFLVQFITPIVKVCCCCYDIIRRLIFWWPESEVKRFLSGDMPSSSSDAMVANHTSKWRLQPLFDRQGLVGPRSES